MSKAVKKKNKSVEPKSKKIKVPHKPKMGDETRKIKLEAKKDQKTSKKISKVTQIMNIEDTVDPVHRSNQTRQWAEKQIARLSKKQKLNRKRYALISGILSILNLSVVILACIALAQLVNASHHLAGPAAAQESELNKIDSQIALASGAAAVTIVIFLLNITTIIYRGFMKWYIYKESLDAIQVEIMKHKFLEGEYKESENIDKLLEDRVNKIYKLAIENKSHKRWQSLLIKALAGGDYE